MTGTDSLNWQRYDKRAQRLERLLERHLSSTHLSDDRKLARVYVGWLGLVKDRLDPSLLEYLSLTEQYAETGSFPQELDGVSARLGSLSQQIALEEAKTGVSTERPFIHQLLESATRRKFTVSAATDAEPVAWMAAIGVPVADIARIIFSVYPELESGWQDEP